MVNILKQWRALSEAYAKRFDGLSIVIQLFIQDIHTDIN